MNNKIKVTGIVVLVIGVIAFLLYSNKAKNKQKIEQAQSVENLAIPVVVEIASKVPIKSDLFLVGIANAFQDVMIISETAGKIIKVNTSVGSNVVVGGVMVEVEYDVKEAAFNAVKTLYEKNKKDFDRYEVLYKDNAISESQFEGVRMAYIKSETDFIVNKKMYDDTKIKSPIAGTVVFLQAEIGQMVGQGSVIANVVNLSKFKGVFQLSERDVFRVKTGDAVDITTDVYPNAIYKGSIKTISAKADPTHNYSVEVIFDNQKENLLKAGMFVRANFKISQDTEAILVPRGAIVGDIRSPRVYVKEGDKAVLRNITIDRESENKVEISAGVSLGEKIIVSGLVNLKDGVIVEESK